MLTSIYLVSTDKRIRAYLIGGLVAFLLAAGSVAYEVRPGDTLSSIASRHDVSLQSLLDNNEIANPDLITPGQNIAIPGEGGGAGSVHVVAGGDTLASIASRYNASISKIAAANELPNPNLIRIGQKLTIPGGGSTSGGSSAATSFHVVQSGDTLASIASEYGVSVNQLAKANGITDPSLIYVGARLALSGDAHVADTAGSTGSATHTVATGDTLGSIARQYGVGLSKLADANGISDVNRIRVGQKLNIPGGAAAWVCPVKGGKYVNDWGFPRSDERFHEGTDIFAPRGTEVVAPVGGEISLKTGTIGGLQFWLNGDDGTTYIGTHMEAFGRSGRVEAGQVIGYVGDTGNARGGPTHLHFEMHPGDAEPVNPFPTLQAAGC